MNIPRSFSDRLHAGFFLLSLLICLSFCTAVSTNAQVSTGSDAASQIDNATGDASGMIDAVVADVQGTTLTLEGGILIDISNAKVFTYTDFLLDRSFVKRGMCIRARIISSKDASAPLVAETIRIRVPNEIVLTGVLQEADVNIDENGLMSGFITLLNRRLPLRRPPFAYLFPRRRKELKVGQQVAVVVVANGTDVVVSAIYPQVSLTVFFP